LCSKVRHRNFWAPELTAPLRQAACRASLGCVQVEQRTQGPERVFYRSSLFSGTVAVLRQLTCPFAQYFLGRLDAITELLIIGLYQSRSIEFHPICGL
jgi:hypothetical protein